MNVSGRINKLEKGINSKRVIVFVEHDQTPGLYRVDNNPDELIRKENIKKRYRGMNLTSIFIDGSDALV
jgi:hypothetical protein